jgi:small subunit ribosomal protein S27e
MKNKGPSSNFIKVKCIKCKNEQTIFGKCATDVKCLVCSELLAKSKGGKADIKAKVVEVLS